MSIQGKVNELNSIQNELTVLRKRSSALRQRAKQIEQEIKDYLDAKDQPGLKYKGMAIIRETKPKHKTKKAVVAIRNPKTKKIRVIRFGAQGYGHNYSPAARKSFKARHAKNIKKGKTSAAYWANKFLWAGPNKRTKNPPKRRS